MLVTPTRLKLDKTKQLEVDWSDGQRDTFPIAYLRKLCPCAGCKTDRAAQAKSRLHVMANYSDGPVTVVDAEPVGNYAIKLHWSDGHASGLYSFDYLREIAPPPPQK